MLMAKDSDYRTEMVVVEESFNSVAHDAKADVSDENSFPGQADYQLPNS